MAGPVLVGAENVILVEDADSYAASRPVTEGIELVVQLRGFPTSKLVVITGQEDTKATDHFCKLNGITGANVLGIAPEDRDIDPADAQWYVIERERARGPIGLVITAYPGVLQRCMSTAQPAILFARRGSLGELELPLTWRDLHSRVIKHRRAEAGVE